MDDKTRGKMLSEDAMVRGFFLVVLAIEVTLAGTCGRVERDCTDQGRCGPVDAPVVDHERAHDLVRAAQSMQAGEVPECELAPDEVTYERVLAADVGGRWRVLWADAQGRACLVDE